MKFVSIVSLAIHCFFMIACTKQTSSTTITETIDTTKAVLRYKGFFQKGPYGTVAGSAELYQVNGRWQLKLDSFSTTRGPDLKVYLSKEIQPLNFIKVADLKSTNGDQVYDISGNPDFALYRYALIHCEQYNHLFGSAELYMR